MNITPDLLTESEQQLFLEKLSTYYHERDAKHFLPYFVDNDEDTLKEMIIRTHDGFAVSEGVGSLMIRGRFYVVKGNDFYRVSTRIYENDDLKNCSYIYSILKNDLEQVVDDEDIKTHFEKIRQHFLDAQQST